MLIFSALIALAAVPYCPPENGQLRWDAVRHTLKGEAGYAVRASIWDRDQSGTPSKGDVIRVEAAWAGARALPIEEMIWGVLGDELAQELAASAAGEDTRVLCESTLAIKQEPPALPNATALARRLDAAARPVQAEQARVTDLQGDLGRWAQEICKKNKYLPAAELAARLVERAAKPYGDLGERAVLEAADSAARDRSLTCTRLTQGVISFD
ncbi:MAG: hypothetical protein H6706_06800 [Myxococcales bacterium]|nr:hypothetical protein [Myxococcales bacterium]